MIHSTLRDGERNTTSLSFVAFERSTEPDPGSPRNSSKLPARAQMLNGRTI
jgi:hypothetical protein